MKKSDPSHTDYRPDIDGLRAFAVTNDVPQFEFDPQRCKFQRPLTQSTKCDVPIKTYQDQLRKYSDALLEVRQLNPDVAWIDLSTLMCDESTCSMARNGQVLYRDTNHLNIPGSQYVGAKIVAQHPSLGKFDGPKSQ